MASKSVTRAITGNNGSYSRILGNFRGVDLTSDPSQVAPDRMAYSVNMWRDYESENGGAIETIPGFRKLFGLGGKIHGIFAFGKDYIVVHSGTSLYRLPKDYFPSNKENDESDDAVTEGSGSISDLFGPKNNNSNVTASEFSQYKLTGTMAEADSSAFEYNGKLYILDGTDYRYITAVSEDKSVYSVANSDAAYIPTSYYNYEPYEQRNMLQKCFINKKTFLRENPVNRAIPVEAYLNVERMKDDNRNFTNNVKILSPKYGGKVYLPSQYTKKEKNDKGEDVETKYTISLFGDRVKDDKNDIITGSFANSDIEQIVIDGDIGEIPAYSFANCKKLQRVVIKGEANNNPDITIQPNAFYGCTALTEIWAININSLIFGTLQNQQVFFENASNNILLYNGVNMFEYDNKTIYIDTFPDEIKKQIGISTLAIDIFNRVISYVGEESQITKSNYETAPEIVPIDGESGITNLVENSDGKLVFTPNKPYAFSVFRCTYVDEGELNGKNRYYTVFTYDRDSGVTNFEGELWWYNFTIMDPCEDVTDVTVNGTSVPFEKNTETFVEGEKQKEYVTSVDVLLPRSFTEEDVEIHGTGVENKFTTVENMANIYQSTTLGEKAEASVAIGKCTVCCAFDGRVFFTGNPNLPNTVFYTQRNNTGANDPSYIGVYNYINDGVGSIPNVAMIAASSMLMVFKEDTTLEGSVFYHTGQDNADTTSQDLIPRIYPSVQGVAGIGCIGAACNFADDAVFISKKGLEAIGKEQVNLERTIQHRSGRIDASLWHTIGKDTKLAEWKGYLVVLTKGGKMYLADSRRVALMQSTGEYQYEWFFLDGIGSYINDKPVYTYVDTDVAYLSDGTNIFGITDLDISKAEKNDVLINGDVKSVAYNGETIYFEEKGDGRKLLVEKTAERTGGKFSPACAVMEHDGDLYFGCENGDVCVFNTDKRGETYVNPYSGEEISVDITEIHPAWYNRCGHRYISGFSTLADNCGYPHFNKSTCGKTLTIKAKNMRNSAFSLRARTNREDWKDIERYVSARHDLSYLDFANANFQTQEQQIFSSREKMKKWAEKQLYFFSDGFCEPFGIYNLAYVFEIVGKVK